MLDYVPAAQSSQTANVLFLVPLGKIDQLIH
jgi:hypothetical protein